ncbi:MAG: hypothetical protein CMK00_08680 [Planctomycetes bacterium]|jgi:uncharacterized membrane protein YfcA|nr:hypothetical protein [Planctomycetota bacterium]
MPVEDPAIILILTLASLAGATLSGFMGMGGGILLLMIMFLAGLDPVLVIPVHALVQLASNGTRVVAYRSHVRWAPLGLFALCALPFPALGLLIADALDTEWTRFAVGMVAITATWFPATRGLGLSEKTAFALLGAVVGTCGVVVGATGPLIAPFFLRGGWRKEQIIATKATCQAYNHLLKIAAFSLLAPAVTGTSAFQVLDQVLLAAPLLAAVVLGTFLGKRLLGHLSEERFRQLYRWLLTLIALRLLLTPLLG